MASSTIILDYLEEGTHANRPAAPPVPPTSGNFGGIAVYHETDTGNDFIWSVSAAAWHQIGGSTTTAIDQYAPPLSASYTIVGSGASPSLADVSNLGMVLDCGASQAGDHIVAAVKNVPGATPYTLQVRLRNTYAPYQYRGAGIIITDGTKYILFGMQAQGASGGTPDNLVVVHFTNSTTFSANHLSLGTFGQVEYLQLVNDGTNLKFSISRDGRNWVQLDSELIGAFLGAITKYGVGANVNNNGGPSGDHVYVACPWLVG